MKASLYYDSQHQCVLSQENGCSLEQWAQKSCEHPFALHPGCFAIFLPPDQLDSCDEYATGDPHGVRGGLANEFQKRRIQCTVDLVNRARTSGAPLGRILDLGCGEGHITNEIHGHFPEMEIAGLDYSVSAIAYANKHWPKIEFCVADAHTPPYKPEYFDLVICNNIWEHVPDPVHLLQGLSRVLKTGGHVLISTPSRYRLDNLAKVIMGRPTTLMAKNHVTEYSVGQVVEQLGYGGYTVESVHSRPMRYDIASIKQFVGYKIAMPILRQYLKAVKSHHNLEQTVFFLARKS